MKGFSSFSCASDVLCKKLATVEGSICQRCNATSMRDAYCELNRCVETNFEKLNTAKPGSINWPKTNSVWFRLSVFGDVANSRIANHLWDFVEHNPQTTFTLWTKNVRVIRRILDKRGKPANLILIRSSLMINKPSKLPVGFDKVFTVYSKDNTTKINCGAKSCISCLKCYNKKDKTVFINERLK